MNRSIKPSFEKAAGKLPVSPAAPVYTKPASFASTGNCYTYALNLPHMDHMLPGRLSDANYDYARFDDIDAYLSLGTEEYHVNYMRDYEACVIDGAVRDGLIAVNDDAPDIVIPDGYNLVALAMKCCYSGKHSNPEWRVRDFHWYRQDAGGLWSQRYGTGGNITNRDEDGNLITDPRTMNRGSYEKFSGFFLVPPGLAFNAAALPVSPDAPAFTPENFGGQGNCYTYALDLPHAETMNPGHLSGWMGGRDFPSYAKIFSMSKRFYHRSHMPAYENLVREGAQADGLIAVPDPAENIVIPRGYNLVAMAVACCLQGEHGDIDSRRRDYHWYRQDSDGLWSHRRGDQGDIVRVDEAGAPLTDPRQAARGDYKKFSGFFLVPRHIGR